MEVSRIERASVNKVEKKKEVATSSVSFAEVMKKGRSDQFVDRLKQLLHDIDDQGKVLAETQTVEELRKYKQLVKDFMKEAVDNGLKLEERRGFNRRGRTKVYKIVKQVDQKLLELTDTVLKEQEKGLKILDLVGEIKGLLVNVYA
ncbi:YaaR family protein [Massilibacterium senegalense]|uniref:YaaR family protein n=1 Tax=Massilibacterium senegalense TaxID=1632858 RepID=UPI0007822259|nr:YaaR family protein [Massilibacterium senegalense]